MNDWILGLLIGITEGITEFLPISSTGHLLLLEHFLGEHQSDLFNVAIQIGAVLAVIPLFWGRVKQMSNFGDPEGRDLIYKIALAFGITGVGGLLMKSLGLKLPETAFPIAMAMLLGGILFVAIEHRLKNRPGHDDLTWTIAIIAGLGQLVAAGFPGASRSGTTILLMLMMGLSRTRATEFSFLIGIPTMLAAGAKEFLDWHKGQKILETLKTGGMALPAPDTEVLPSQIPALLQNAQALGMQINEKQLIKALAANETQNWSLLAWTSVVSAVVAFISVKWLLKYVQSNTFAAFGWYRIGFGSLLLTLILLGYWN